MAQLGSLPAVHSALGLLGFASSLSASGGRSTHVQVNRGSPVAVVGLDFDAGRALYRIDAARGRLPRRGANEVALTRDLAAKLGVQVGEQLRVAAPAGDRPMTVVGVMGSRGIGRLLGVALTSLPTAQAAVGQGAVVSYISLRLGEGVDPGRWQHDHAADVGALRLTSGGGDIDFALRQLSFLSSALTILAAGIVFVAGFLVYLTLSTAVIERIRLYGLLQSLGATRRQVRLVVIGEAAALGLLASTAGAALGLGVAKLLLVGTTRFIEGASLRVSPAALILG